MLQPRKDVLREQLALAATEIERLRGLLPRPGDVVWVPSFECDGWPWPWLVVSAALGAALAALVLL